MRTVAFDYTLWGVDEITDLRVEADVDLRARCADVRAVTVIATGAPLESERVDELRRELEADAVLVAEEQRDHEVAA